MNDALSYVEESSAILSQLPEVLEMLLETWHLDNAKLTQEDVENIRLQHGSISAIIKTVENCIASAEEKLDKAAALMPGYSINKEEA